MIDGKIEDNKRIKFLQDNIAQVYRAKRDGVNVNGYSSGPYLTILNGLKAIT
jgi:beta-glucosidase/6-phospho-beta-glucosidase/beta-galactosidase